MIFLIDIGIAGEEAGTGAALTVAAGAFGEPFRLFRAWGSGGEGAGAAVAVTGGPVLPLGATTV
ncbi:MAG TPA: hypothetical protein VN815_00265, partial [Steroidobacteraceae bacterium]|nr:hypothetical protein [Steroidobacteraceae bacterium]